MTTTADLIASLEHSGMFREYERAFTELTGLPIALCPVNGWHLPFRGKRRENRFCALIRSSSKACAACLQAQEALYRDARHTAAMITCKYGFEEIAVPVRIGNETIAFLQTGQVLRRRPSPAQFKAILNHLREAGVQLDEEKLSAAFFHSPTVSKKRLDAIVHLLSIFADHLADRSNQIAISHITSEPSIVVRGKQYIRDHLNEELSLKRVATAVNASPFHFCKVFKAVTGVHFTEYVSRMRVEKAKELLLDHHQPISDIAYHAGFQSLTHFNRMFRRIAGRSPTEFRAHAALYPQSGPVAPHRVGAFGGAPESAPP